MQFLKRKAFTLVELIVVITILAILGTIGFISLQGYALSARESSRISDLNTIAKSLELFRTINSYYPDPTNSFQVTYTGALAWNQGIFGETTRNILQRISQVPTDPLTKNPYAYSLTNTRQEYELGAISEKSFALGIFSPQTYAANGYVSMVKGNYNQKFVTVKDSLNIYVLGVPTIITSEINNVTVDMILANQSFAVRNTKNLPGSYSNSLPSGQTLKDGTSFIPGTLSGSITPVVYIGGITALNFDTEKQKFGENLKSYYQSSNLTQINIPSAADVFAVQTGQELSYVNTIITGNQGGLNTKEITVHTIPQENPCYDIDNIGTVGNSGICNNLLIVDKTLLQTVISSGYIVGGTTYSTSLPNGVFVGQIKDFSYLFQNNTSFNQDISYWDMSQAENLSYMFDGASSFNQNVSSWNISNVTDMLAMFRSASSFNQNISSWNTSKVQRMGSMFASASAFNQNISSWNTSALSGSQAMNYMFDRATVFNQPIGSWDISKVTSLYGTFKGPSAFNQDISSWNTANITTIGAIFKSNIVFNQNISSWNTTNITNMLQSFNGATGFDQNISSWNTNNVTTCTSFSLSSSGLWTTIEKPNFISCTP